MHQWYDGNFNWKTSRNQYEQILIEMRKPQSRSRSRVPSLSLNRQMSRVPSQQSQSSSEQSSQGSQLIPIWRANAGILINGEINGFRLQVIFSIIHRVVWMTETTAQRCGITG